MNLQRQRPPESDHFPVSRLALPPPTGSIIPGFEAGVFLSQHYLEMLGAEPGKAGGSCNTLLLSICQVQHRVWHSA